VGNGERSIEDLIYCQRGGAESSDYQIGHHMRSSDPINFQESRGEIPIFQVGMGEEMRLFESLRSS
jgi:hypothetical protein